MVCRGVGCVVRCSWTAELLKIGWETARRRSERERSDVEMPGGTGALWGLPGRQGALPDRCGSSSASNLGC